MSLKVALIFDCTQIACYRPKAKGNGSERPAPLANNLVRPKNYGSQRLTS